MKPSKSWRFVMVPTLLFDLAVVGVLSPRLLMAYLTLLRYTWKTDKRGTREQRQFWRDGLIVTTMTQEHLAHAVGLERRQSANELLRELVALGWIKVVVLDGRSRGYQLGYRDPKRGNVFFVEEWLKALEERTAAKTKKRRPFDERLLAARTFVHESDGVRTSARVRSNGQHGSGSAHALTSNAVGSAHSIKREGSEREKTNSNRVGVPHKPSWIVFYKTDGKSSIRALDRVRGDDVARWSPKAMFGWYVEHWERQHRRSFDDYLQGRGLQKARWAIEQLVRREGLATAKRAIEIAVQHERISDPLPILARPDLFGRWLLPLVVKPRVAPGESAQWTGPTSDEPGSIKGW